MLVFLVGTVSPHNKHVVYLTGGATFWSAFAVRKEQLDDFAFEVLGVGLDAADVSQHFVFGVLRFVFMPSQRVPLWLRHL